MTTWDRMRDEDIPADMQEIAEEYRANLIEKVAETDDALMEKYLEGGELTEDEIRTAIRKCTIACTMNPVLCGTSYRNKGVQPLLDAVVDYMPSPLDIPAIDGVDPNDSEKKMERHPSDDEPFSALAFKIMVDPFVGKLAFFRVLRYTERRKLCNEFHEAEAGAHQPDYADARQSPGRGRHDLYR